MGILTFLVMESIKWLKQQLNVLAINSGSSSLKFKIIAFDESPNTAARCSATAVTKDL